MAYTLEARNKVQAVAIRGRDGGAAAELGGEQANALRASSGGGDKAFVLAPTVVHGTQDPLTSDIAFPLGRNSGQENAVFAEKTIGFSSKDYGADAADGLSPTLRAMGHSGIHANAGGQVAVCITGSVTHTLKAEGFDASEDGTGRGQPIVAATLTAQYGKNGGIPAGKDCVPVNLIETPMAVRRLMPVECERLQGFPPGWTDVPVGNKRAADGPRYKQLGNSWAVPCVAWIARRIQAEVNRLDAKPQPTELSYNTELMLWSLVL